MAGMVVQHNLNALNSYNRLNANVSGLRKASEKLSSGYRINRAGDDAAGLAISEKMRSQIRGLNQAKRNAQDGISMIQTYEGALQETHSILQRMKELATESANGTYDDATDRAAIQLEFDQLNDELNQIADTDFNGVVALNGGVMADGAVADETTGMIDYSAQAAQAAAALKAEQELIDSAEHFSGDTVGSILDNAGYSKDVADAIWGALGVEADSTTTADPDELQLDFAFDGSNWKVVGAYKNGELVEDAKLDALTITPVDGDADTTGKGGFTISANGESMNVIFDTSDVQKYDTASITLDNVNASNYAPANGGLLEGSYDDSGLTAGNVEGTPTLSMTLKDEEMDADLKEILDGLKGNEITLTYDAGALDKVELATDAITATSGVEYTLAIDETTGQITATGDDAATTTFNIGTMTFGTPDGDADGAIKFELNFDSYNFVDDSDLEAVSSALNTNTKVEVGMFDKEAASGGVSVPDAYDQSTAKLTYTDTVTLQVGARTKDAVDFTFEYESQGMGTLEANMNVSARADGLKTADLNLTTQESANAAIDKIDNAINKVSMVRATFGSIQNRLEHKIENITTTTENMTEAESTIRDTDMASEMMNYTKYNILQQAAQSMLAQANQQPQSILQLLG